MTEAAEAKRRTREDVPERDDDLIRLAEVEKMSGLRKSTIYKRVGEGTFPAPRQLGGGAVRWRRGAIQEWVEGLPVTRASAA